MTILLLAEHDNKALSEQTAKVLSAATKIGGDVHVLMAGSGASAVAEAAAKLSGVAKVLVADDAAYAQGLSEPLTDLIVSLAGGYDVVIGAATSVAKSVLPRVAALLDVMQVSEIIEVVSADTFKRPIYAGNAIQTVQSSDAKKVITVRTASFAAAPAGGSAAIEAVASAGDKGVSTFVSEAIAVSERPELTAAKIIISGGRALGSSEKFNEVILPVDAEIPGDADPVWVLALSQLLFLSSASPPRAAGAGPSDVALTARQARLAFFSVLLSPFLLSPSLAL